MPAQAPGWATSYLGIPYRYRGRSRAGCDCWGLARLVLEERFALRLPCLGRHAPSADDHQAIEAGLLAHLGAFGWREVGDRGERAGDLALMHTIFLDADRRLRAAVAHLGLVVAEGALIHVEAGGVASAVAYRGEGADRVLARRLAGFRRHPRLARAGTERQMDQHSLKGVRCLD